MASYFVGDDAICHVTSGDFSIPRAFFSAGSFLTRRRRWRRKRRKKGESGFPTRLNEADWAAPRCRRKMSHVYYIVGKSPAVLDCRREVQNSSSFSRITSSLLFFSSLFFSLAISVKALKALKCIKSQIARNLLKSRCYCVLNKQMLVEVVDKKKRKRRKELLRPPTK